MALTFYFRNSSYINYYRTLKDFLERGIERFLNLEVAKGNYRRDRGKISESNNEGKWPIR